MKKILLFFLSFVAFNNESNAANCLYNSTPFSTVKTSGTLGITFSADKKCIIAAIARGQTTIIPLNNYQAGKAVSRTFEKTSISWVALSSNNCLAVAESSGKTVSLYKFSDCNFSETAPVATISGFDGLRGLAFSPDGKNLAITDLGVMTNYQRSPKGGSCKIYSITDFKPSAEPIATITELNNPFGVAYSADNKYLAVSCRGANLVNIYSISNNIPSKEPVSQISDISFPFGVAFSPNNSCIAITTSNSINIYSFADGKPSSKTVLEIKDLQMPSGITFSSDGDCLAVSAFAGGIKFYLKAEAANSTVETADNKQENQKTQSDCLSD